ncbi:MAG TPA: hypothetical protein VGE30_03645 [Candidatus Saccharimonadales bacterium]
MFEKLLANLPYNPDLVKQISFYAGRLKREQAVRRTGLVFIVLAFMVQFFAFISPPQETSAAYSNSDMINNGITSKADAVAACRDNIKNFGDVMWNFHITCADIANASVTTIRSTDYNERLYSMSWHSYGQNNPRTGKPTDETPYNLPKVAETLYARKLNSADTIPFSTYRVLKGENSKGRTFYIMFDCGNLMFVGLPNPADICRRDGNIYYAGDERCNPPKPEEPVKVCPFDKSLPLNSPKCKPCKFDNTIPADSRKCVKPCPYNENLPKDSSKCRPCKEGTIEDAAACIVERKTASNKTQGITEANNTTAQPNDVIVYTLFAENKGKAAVKNFVMQENLSDVLDYAVVVNLHGGKLAKTSNIVSWPATTIKPGDTLTHKITVRVKNPLPTNTPPAGDPSHFDLVMTNVYGNAVNIKLPSPTPTAVTPVITASEELPKTGPGTGLVIAGLVVITAGYFFSRTRLLVDESMIVIQEANVGGKL